jgi:RNA polymerase sigma factor (sigma-70 family)
MLMHISRVAVCFVYLNICGNGILGVDPMRIFSVLGIPKPMTRDQSTADAPINGAREETILRYARQMVAPGSAHEVEEARLEVEKMFQREQGRIQAICRKFLRNPEAAQDAAQDVMLIAYSKLPEFRGQSSVRSWLYGIARYRCYDINRKKTEALGDDGIHEIMDGDPGVLKTMRKRERAQLLHDAAEAVLDPMEKRAIFLRYEEMMSQDEIAVILGLETASGGRGLLQRCRRKLHRELRRRLEEMGHGSSFIRTAT